MPDPPRRALTESFRGPESGASVVPGTPRGPSVLPPVPPDWPAELVELMGADILAKVDRRWPKRHHGLGPRLVWRDGEAHGPDAQTGPYGRIYDPALKRTDYAHRWCERRVYGPIPVGLDVDHLCKVTLCQRPDHLQLLTKPDNTRRRGPTPPKRADA